MTLAPVQFRGILDDQPVPASQCADRQWIAVAGIGNPQRFFDTLQAMDLVFEPRSFPDHHAYSLADFAGLDQASVLTTEKDAVKLRTLGINGTYLAVEARIRPELIDDVLNRWTLKHRPHAVTGLAMSNFASYPTPVMPRPVCPENRCWILAANP
ncbi:MAG: tetraacyldisaccharide 4'-kinase [Gammaproteobacteria bacterium]